MYQIVLLENGKKLKVLYTYTRLYDANYRMGVLKNKKVSMPKKFIYRDKILEDVNYDIILQKRKEEGDKSIVIRDSYGKLMGDLMDDPDWVVLGKETYQLEEQFNVTGANRKLSAIEIINNVLLPNLSEKNTKQVVILNNKIVIEGINLYMITCKTVEEAIRLYNKLRTYSFDNNVVNIIFFGSIQKVDKSSWYKKIHDITGVSYNRLYRKSSR
jgi:hypothetical protein